MDKLIIEPTPKTPYIIFDPDDHKFEISGRSLPENVIKTYDPVLKWIDNNFGSFNNEINFDFKVDYLNSASAKMISLILSKLEEFYKNGQKIQVNWFYNTDDDDILSEGKLLSSLKKCQLN
jgi:SiaC family regulatory phosphoprotein